MTKRRLRASVAPQRPAPIGFTDYLPEEFYFQDQPVAPIEDILGVTIAALSRFATHYRALWLGDPNDVREGRLPDKAEARARLVDEVFRWLLAKADPGRWYLLSFSLYQDGQSLLSQEDGAPGMMTVTQEQFASLQQNWREHSLPDDLYYPAEKQRWEVEPVDEYGGVVRVLQRYSPRRWENRDVQGITATQVPTEEERTLHFQRKLSDMRDAVMLRIAELTEPGKTIDRSLHYELTVLLRQIHRVSEMSNSSPGPSD